MRPPLSRLDMSDGEGIREKNWRTHVEMFMRLSPEERRGLPAPTLMSKPTTSPRPLPELLNELPLRLRPQESAVLARVGELCERVRGLVIQ